MEIHHHPNWPKEDPKTLIQLQEYLISHFQFLFSTSKNVDDIRLVLAWMRKDSSDILQWKEADTFFTLFSPFHTGQPFMKRMLSKYIFPERIKAFLDTCTSLEKTTDQFAYLEKLEDLQYKEDIILDLKRFLENLPSQEQFAKSVESIQKK